MLLENKVALITGGSRGIGEAIVRHFIDQGADVAFTYRSSDERSNKLIAELSPKGNKIKAYQSDAGSYEQCEALVKQVLEDFGKIDVLINNAGITRDNLMLRMNEESWDQVMETNLKAVFNMTKQILRPMMKNRDGAIINMGSVVGVFGNAGQANYAASKAGIIGFSKSVAKELGSRNIRCNVVAPGFIETEMTKELDEKTREAYLDGIPLKRLGEANEVAQVCAFLSSAAATYITGQVISVCGGLNI